MGGEVSFCCAAHEGRAGWAGDGDDIMFAAPDLARADPVLLQLRALGEGSPRRWLHAGAACVDRLAGFAQRARAEESGSVDSEATLTSALVDVDDLDGRTRAFAGAQSCRALTVHELGSGRFAAGIWRVEPEPAEFAGAAAGSRAAVSRARSGDNAKGRLRLEACALSPPEMAFGCCHLFAFDGLLLLAVSTVWRGPRRGPPDAGSDAEAPSSAIYLYSMQEVPDANASLEASLQVVGELWASEAEMRGRVTHLCGHQGTLVSVDEHGSMVIWKLQAGTSPGRSRKDLASVSVSGIPSHVENLREAVVALEVRSVPSAQPQPGPTSFELPDARLAAREKEEDHSSSAASGPSSEISVVTAAGSLRVLRFWALSGAVSHRLDLTVNHPDHESGVLAVAFAPAPARASYRRVPAAREPVFSLVFVALQDGRVQTWDLRRAAENALVAEHTSASPVSSLAFGPFSNGPLMTGEAGSGEVRKLDLGGHPLPSAWRPGFAASHFLVEPGHAVYAFNHRGHVVKLD